MPASSVCVPQMANGFNAHASLRRAPGAASITSHAANRPHVKATCGQSGAGSIVAANRRKDASLEDEHWGAKEGGTHQCVERRLCGSGGGVAAKQQPVKAVCSSRANGQLEVQRVAKPTAGCTVDDSEDDVANIRGVGARWRPQRQQRQRQ